MADAEYIIDIASQMPDGEVTAAQLDELIGQLDAGGRNADGFQRAIQKVSGSLDAARAASAAANAELAAAQGEYRALERAADRASKVVERAFAKGDAVPDDVVAEMDRARAAVDEYAAKLRVLEKASADAAADQVKLTASLGKVRKAAKHVDDRLGDATRSVSVLRGAFGDIGGPAGELAEKVLFPAQAFVDLKEQFGETAAKSIIFKTAIAGAALGVVFFSGVVAIATAGVAALAVKLADNNREAGLAAEAYDALHPRVAALRPAFEDITDATGLGAVALQGLEEQLHAAGVSAADMPEALRAAALAERALGQGGASKFVEDLRDGKLSVDEFAVNAQQKFGGIVQRQMLGLGAQVDTLKRNFSKLFGGLNIEPVLEGLRILSGLFDKNTEAGRATKALFEAMFQPLIDKAKSAALVFEAFYLGFLIGLMEIYVAFQPVIDAVAEFFGFEDRSLTAMLELAETAGKAVAVAFVTLAAIFGVVLTLIGLVVLGFVSATAAAFALGYAIGVGIVEAVDFMIGVFGKVVDFFKNLDFAEIGRNIIMGLVGGLTGNASAVVNALRNIMGSAISAAKKALGIASPSKVFAEIGGYTSEGFAVGVEDEAPAAQSALSEMVSPPVLPPSALSQMGAAAAVATAEGAAGGGAAGGGAAGGISLSGVTFNFYGVEGAEDARARFAEDLTRILEGDAAQVGGGIAA